MANTYIIENGRLALQPTPPSGWYRLKQAALFLMRFTWRLSALLLVLGVIWLSYKKSGLAPTLESTISFGAVFATLGSSLVSVASLFCSRQQNQFENNTEILQSKLINKGWERWPFVGRVTRRKLSRKRYEYQILENPQIKFSLPDRNALRIPLPSSKADFRELWASLVLSKMKICRKHYRKLIGLQGDPQAIREVLVWDCVFAVYRNILLYKLGQVLIWVGGCFVGLSIIFSCFYPYI